jgi:hypothetical protein
VPLVALLDMELCCVHKWYPCSGAAAFFEAFASESRKLGLLSVTGLYVPCALHGSKRAATASACIHGRHCACSKLPLALPFRATQAHVLHSWRGQQQRRCLRLQGRAPASPAGRAAAANAPAATAQQLQRLERLQRQPQEQKHATERLMALRLHPRTQQGAPAAAARPLPRTAPQLQRALLRQPLRQQHSSQQRPQPRRQQKAMLLARPPLAAQRHC